MIANVFNRQNLYKKVAWIVQKETPGVFPGSCVSLRNLELADYIEMEQYKQNIPEQFRIDFSNETQKEALVKILEAHRENVLKEYFSDWLSISRKICNLNNEEYYFFSLCYYLNEELGSYHGYIGAYYSQERISKYMFKVKLTELGRTYYKLYLIVRIYVEGNKHLLDIFTLFDKKRKDYIMEDLEKNETKFMDYN